ncbi:ABC transporter permease [Pedosphaera parvula]|uniref:ABC transporter permease n=1 Tax=Pedosphaera parvula TaxID=1032527 RepID=UPI0002FC44CB|nr:ABC transporter permease [Pedosphaera parvula]
MNTSVDPKPSETHFGQHLSRAGHFIRAAFTAGPATLWLVVLLLVPLAAIGAISFMSRGDYGEIELPFTIENYKRLLGFGMLGFDSLYPIILFRSLTLGIGTALACVITGLPLAFFIARLPARFKTPALTLVVIPFWTNLLIRTYAWQILLAPESWITQFVHAIGIGKVDEPLQPSTFAVGIGMICDYLPFLVLPLYTSVEKLDWSLAEAAMDLGANRIQVFRHALLPQIMPGLFAGMILVLLPATGQFVIPDLLGGAKTVMLGNAIQQQFGQSRDWPFGSAIAFVALGLVMMGLWLYARKSQGKGEPTLL